MGSRVGHAGGDPLDILRHDISSPIDPYRMGLRSVKYALLFMSLSYPVFWLMEVLHPTRIHPIQYLLIGAGICLFYLLELSLAEHVGFFIAYAAASMCITLIVGLYTWSVLKSLPKAWTISGVLCGLYGLPICRAQKPGSRTAHRFHRAGGGSWIHHVFDSWHAPQGTALSDPTHNLNAVLRTSAKAFSA